MAVCELVSLLTGGPLWYWLIPAGLVKLIYPIIFYFLTLVITYVLSKLPIPIVQTVAAMVFKVYLIVGTIALLISIVCNLGIFYF